MPHGDPDCRKHEALLLDELTAELVNWLSETKYMYGLTAIPPSRFNHLNANDLWE
jgi:hypothetical protein